MTNFNANGSSHVGEMVLAMTCSNVIETEETSTASDASQFEPSQLSSKAKKAKFLKNVNRMTWDNTSINILVGEVALAHPFKLKYKTAERGKAWQQVAEAMQRKGYKVDSRAVRDRINLLKEQVKVKKNLKKAASGVTVEEAQEEKRIREAVEEMIQEEMDTEMGQPKEKAIDEQKTEGDNEESRKRAFETVAETRKRHLGEWGTSTPPQRNRGRDTLAFLDRKMELDQEMKRKEMERRREEEERQRAAEMERRREEEERRRADEEKRQADEAIREHRFEIVQQQILQQKQQSLQQQKLMQQHIQQMQSMMMALIKSLEKKHQGECGTSTSNIPQTRNRGRETLAFMEKKMELEQETKREEMEWRREEEERQRVAEMERRREEEERRRADEEKRQAEIAIQERRFEMVQQQMVQQQQQSLQQQQLMQQHNQQMQSMMMALIKSLENN